MEELICQVPGCNNKRALIRKGKYRKPCQKHHNLNKTVRCPYCERDFNILENVESTNP